MNEALELKVTGVVQGVGFRPFVYRMAQKYHLVGWVYNNTEGVFIHVEGSEESLDRFVVEIAQNAPDAAQIKEIDISEVDPQHPHAFEIRFSCDSAQEKTTLVSPDLATCSACVAELFDPTDRRYRYPFINCTNCGPRFTIMRGLPYDRPATSMAEFDMCATCQTEYDDPGDRRFHAQPDACFECGPHLGWTTDAEKGIDGISWAHTRQESDEYLARAVKVLREGGIVAVKGLGGYHLVCDANNTDALMQLRKRKRREGKAFAVMVSCVDDARDVCFVSDAEEQQLKLPARPIVLLRKRPDAHFAYGLADDLPELGVMLPTTPVQYLLAHDFGGMLVMTSGNIHDEPIVTTEEDALCQLADVADAFLVNNRIIEGRYDDSVLRVLDAGPAGDVVQMIRRARGYAPLPLSIPRPEDPVSHGGEDAHVRENESESDCLRGANTSLELFATGPEQKNTFTFVRDDQAFVSQHIGDMESSAVMDAWNETRVRFADLLRLKPQKVMCDYHPEYLTTKWARSQDMPVHYVQHHHAHVLAVMGENNLQGPVCGFAFDGTGYGVDGALWGGEVLLSNLQAFERFANFVYIPLPGGAAAIKNPSRVAYGALWAFDLLEHRQAQRFVNERIENALLFEQMIEKGINTPLSSSVGRLFDAASALLGICDSPRYEGEAAILLEAAITTEEVEPDERYTIALIKNTATESSTAQDTSVLLMDPAPLFEALLDDLESGVDIGIIARRFHDAFVQAILSLSELVRAMYDISTVALAGGVFMNRYLTEHVLAQLQDSGFTVALNRDLPPNDASISYGQAVLGLQAWTKE